MNQQPDIFFRKKLQDYHKPMPADAWSKIEINLDKKNTKAPWLKVAASVSIIMLVACLLWIVSSSKINSSTNNISQRTNPALSPSRNIKPSKQSVVVKNNKTITPTVEKKNKTNSSVKFETQQRTIKPYEITDQRTTPLLHEKPIEFSVDVQPNLNDSASNTLSERTQGSQAGVGHVLLIYTAEEVREKYLDKNITEEATPTDEKPSMFKKLLSKVHDLKNNQDPLGELRKKKDEILALNFKKRTEN